MTAIDSINPIGRQLTDIDYQEWAHEEYWFRAVAISRVVSATDDDMNTKMAKSKNLLAITIREDWRSQVRTKTTTVNERDYEVVHAYDWLKWCNEIKRVGINPFVVSAALWDAVSTRKLDGKAGGAIELTDRQQAQIILIEEVRARLVDRYNAGDTSSRLSAIRHLMSTGVLPRLLRNFRYKGDNFEDKARKLTDPNQMPNLGLGKGYLKHPF